MFGFSEKATKFEKNLRRTTLLSAKTNYKSKAAFSLVFLIKNVANLIKAKNIFFYGQKCISQMFVITMQL